MITIPKKPWPWILGALVVLATLMFTVNFLGRRGQDRMPASEEKTPSIRELLTVELVIDPPSKTISIQRGGVVMYGGGPSGSLTGEEMNALAYLIGKNRFFHLADGIVSMQHPQSGHRGSLLALTVEAEMEDGSVRSHTVRCGSFYCDRRFLEIKDFVFQAWQGDFLDAAH